MFETARAHAHVVCGGRSNDALHQAREKQADYYAATFLVPQVQLLRLQHALDIEGSWRFGVRLSSRDLWAMVLQLSDHFLVTGALMARRLEDLGWIVRKGPNLSIHPQGWLPLGLHP